MHPMLKTVVVLYMVVAVAVVILQLLEDLGAVLYMVAVAVVDLLELQEEVLVMVGHLLGVGLEG
jgi:hypothetical protein